MCGLIAYFDGLFWEIFLPCIFWCPAFAIGWNGQKWVVAKSFAFLIFFLSIFFSFWRFSKLCHVRKVLQLVELGRIGIGWHCTGPTSPYPPVIATIKPLPSKNAAKLELRNRCSLLPENSSLLEMLITNLDVTFESQVTQLIFFGKGNKAA